MKKLLFLTSITLLAFGCKKESTLQQPVAKTTTTKTQTFSHADTTTAYSFTNHSKLKVQSYTDLSLHIQYIGNGSYQVIPSIYLPGGNYNISYTLFREGGVVVDQGVSSGSSRSYTFTDNLPPGNYSIEIYVHDSPNYGGAYYAPLGIVPEPSTIPGTANLYRYLNQSTGLHFYTTSWEEMATGADGYWFEEVQCVMYPSTMGTTTGLKPVYRYYNPSTGEHFYTGNGGSYNGYNFELITGYVDVSPNSYGGTTDFTVGLGRYFNSSNGWHFYTTSPAEAASAGYALEGTIGYVKLHP